MVDLISLLPDNDVRRVVAFCLNDRGLTLAETERVLYDATKIMGAVNLLLEGRVISAKPESTGQVE